MTRVITVASGRFAPGHLGELTQVVPFEMVDAVLAESGAVQTRLRDLPSRVVVYLLLSAAMFEGLGYTQVWHRLVAQVLRIAIADAAGHAGIDADRASSPSLSTPHATSSSRQQASSPTPPSI